MMDEITKIAVEEFEKKPDGSWVCVKNSDVGTKQQRIMRLKPGMTFRKGLTFCGVDIAEALDKISAK